MNRIIVLPVALPLLAAALTVAVRNRRFQRIVSFSTMAAVLLIAGLLVQATAGGRVLATQVGDWQPPFAIPFAVDALAALMLTVASLMVLVCTAFASARREDDQPLYHTLVLVLHAGLGGAFLTADLFNLFVFFEVMLISSYVLLVLGGSRDQIRGGAVYVLTNLLGSTILLIGVALLYGETGTVNMAELSLRIRDTGTAAVAGGLMLVAFSVKAALVPVHGWLPRSYPDASPAVSAMFSGLLTKVGLYALYRVYATVFGGDPRLRTVLVVLASVTMVVGVLGALGRNGMREILSFHVVSQVGYILMGLAIFGPLGLAAGIFYMLHHVVVKTSLFLGAGAVETFRGTGQLGRVSGLARSHPVLAAAFVVSALSLAGLPPLSGFFGKLLLIDAAFEAGRYGIGAVAVVVSFFTLMSMLKVWNGVFWNTPPPDPSPVSSGALRPVAGGAVEQIPDRRGWWTAAVVAPAVVLAVTSILLGLGAQGLAALADTAAQGLVDPSTYVREVLGR